MRFVAGARRPAVAAAVIVPLIALAVASQAQAAAPTATTASGSNYDWSNVAISGGGYVPGIIYNPTEEGLVYARTDIGGAYRLDRDTDTWIPLLDHVG